MRTCTVPRQVHWRSCVGIADWIRNATQDMTEAQLQRMLDTEHGGMTEVLADVSALTGKPEYLVLARRFAHQKLLQPFAQDRDTLDGLHSNTQIPKFIGMQRVQQLDGDAELAPPRAISGGRSRSAGPTSPVATATANISSTSPSSGNGSDRPRAWRPAARTTCCG